MIVTLFLMQSMQDSSFTMAEGPVFPARQITFMTAFMTVPRNCRDLANVRLCRLTLGMISPNK